MIRSRGRFPAKTFSKGRECPAEAEGARNFDEGVFLGRELLGAWRGDELQNGDLMEIAESPKKR